MPSLASDIFSSAARSHTETFTAMMMDHETNHFSGLDCDARMEFLKHPAMKMEQTELSQADKAAASHPHLSTPRSSGTQSSISVDVMNCDQLTQPHWEAWARIRQSNPLLTSPCYHLEFTRAVSRCRDDVKIAMASRGTDVIAFLPFQSAIRGHAHPVGGLLNDFHGPITGPSASLDLHRFVREIGLASWQFHALYPYDVVSAESRFEIRPSPYLDLSAGFEAYLAGAQQRASTVKRQAQKTRGMIRDAGPLRFEFESPDFAALEHLITLKRAKYRRTHVFDVLSVPWCANLLREVHAARTPNFRGILSTLSAGRHLVALHMGMLSGHTLHYWFPVFDPRFARYSPGTQLILETARHAAGLGVTIVDLSYGELPFKTRLASDAWEVASGRIQRNSWRRGFGRWHMMNRERLRDLLFSESVRKCVRTVVPQFGRHNYR